MLSHPWVFCVCSLSPCMSLLSIKTTKTNFSACLNFSLVRTTFSLGKKFKTRQSSYHGAYKTSLSRSRPVWQAKNLFFGNYFAILSANRDRERNVYATLLLLSQSSVWIQFNYNARKLGQCVGSDLGRLEFFSSPLEPIWAHFESAVKSRARAEREGPCKCKRNGF